MGATNNDLVMYIKALELALKQSNLDKAALREWAAEVNK
jgi:hypothetical protein